MQHINEHTIELYVLGSASVEKRRDEIQRHVAECHGCRALAEQMEAFYRKAEEHLADQPQRELTPTKALVRSSREPIPFEEPLGYPIPNQPRTPIQKFAYFIRRHPVMAGASGFAVAAVIVAALMFGVRDFAKDSNPAYVHVNTNQGKLEVYNVNHDFLWSLPSRDLQDLKGSALEESYERVVLFDLDGDGRNEVITSLPFGGQMARLRPLSVFSYEHKLLHQKTFKEQIQFRGKLYEENLGADELTCGQYYMGGNKEILVGATTGRSPHFLFRLDHSLNELGYYVHYGYMNLSLMDFPGGKKRIFLFGQNDLGEIDSLAYAVMAILDPEKIVGRTESSGSPGFGLAVSQAELFYIRFPLTDLNYYWNSHSKASSIEQTLTDGRRTYNVRVLGFHRDSTLESEADPEFEYVFSDKMEVTAVKFNSGSLWLRQRLVAEGKLRGTFDQTYLDNLKNGVRYWDGKEWRKDPTRVNHEPPISLR